MCVQIGLLYPDMHNLPILSDYVKFLRLASLMSVWKNIMVEMSPKNSGD